MRKRKAGAMTRPGSGGMKSGMRQQAVERSGAGGGGAVAAARPGMKRSWNQARMKPGIAKARSEAGESERKQVMAIEMVGRRYLAAACEYRNKLIGALTREANGEEALV